MRQNGDKNKTTRETQEILCARVQNSITWATWRPVFCALDIIYIIYNVGEVIKGFHGKF
jgi:hypothetical protein